jgi:hypothetical protein
MTLLSITEFLCLCSICRNHIPVLFSFKAYHRVYSQSNTTGVVNGVRTAYPSGSSEITLVEKTRELSQVTHKFYHINHND